MHRSAIVASLFAAGLWLLGTTGVAFAGADQGKKVFEAKKCINCHSLGDQKGPMAKLGGPLDGVGGKRDAAWLKAYLSDPKSKIDNAKMPKQKLADPDLSALVDYLSSLK